MQKIDFSEIVELSMNFYEFLKLIIVDHYFSW
jgi:hypothetical protein